MKEAGRLKQPRVVGWAAASAAVERRTATVEVFIFGGVANVVSEWMVGGCRECVGWTVMTGEREVMRERRDF